MLCFSAVGANGNDICLCYISVLSIPKGVIGKGVPRKHLSCKHISNGPDSCVSGDVLQQFFFFPSPSYWMLRKLCVPRVELCVLLSLETREGNSWMWGENTSKMDDVFFLCVCVCVCNHMSWFEQDTSSNYVHIISCTEITITVRTESIQRKFSSLAVEIIEHKSDYNV